MAQLHELSTCLAKFVRHIRRGKVAMTGGVAIDAHLAARGAARSRDVVSDLDFVASRIDAIAPTVAADFLVFHYHVQQPHVPKFMIQLVDPESRIRVDVFPDLVNSIGKAVRMTVAGETLDVLALDTIFEHKVQTLSKATGAHTVDPKHLRDARLLGAALGRDVIDVPSDALAKDVYGGEGDRVCRRCDVSRHPEFPLAPKGEILRLLGWPR